MKSITQIAAALFFLAALVFASGYFTAKERDDALRLWFFDVGQGDAILIDTPEGYQVLVDGGPNDAVVQRLGQALPFTDKDLDLVVISHNHSDHLRGILSVLQRYEISEIWISGAIHTTDTYGRFLETVRDKGVKLTVVQAGHSVALGLLEGVVLFPFANMTGQMPENQHEASVVTYWQYGGVSWLLTGDAETPQELEMARRGVLRPVDILKVGHHGSRTSTSETLLKITQPKIAIIQVGRRNRFGHPHREVLERLQRFAIPVLRNDTDRTIRFNIWPDRYDYQASL